MNASRPVAALAAVAIGFGVTLLGVALADDSNDADNDTLVVATPTGDASDDRGAGDNSNEGADAPDSGDIDIAGEVDVDDAAADDADELVEPRPRDTDQALPPTTVADTVADTTPDSVPDTTPVATDVPEAPTPRPPATTDDDDEASNGSDDVQCVDTISVESEGGDRFDFVVVERGSGGTWLVRSVDGVFEVSLDDPGVVRITDVRRDVFFVQGAAVDFLDTCDVLGASLGTESGNLELAQGLT